VQVREGRNQSLSECLKKEFRLTMNILRTTISEDMYEVNVAMLLKMFEFSSLLISKSNFHFDFKGIRALTIDKDNAPKVLS
jgi:3-hydroxyisobutyryl-CoA hydrolase